MTRIFTDGAEFGDSLFFEVGTAEIVTSPKRSGVYAYGVQGALGYDPTKLLPSSMTDLYFRCGVYSADLGTVTIPCIEFKNGSNLVVQVAINTDLKLQVSVGDTVVDTSDYAFLESTWVLLDMHLQVGASGVFELKQDGLLSLYYSGDTRGNSQTQVDRIHPTSGYLLGFYPVTYFDDLACNSTAGLVDNFWCGDGHVELLRPNGNGDLNEWVGSDSDSTDNYLLVDDIPSDGDTTYVGTALSSKLDEYNLSSYSSSGKTVKRIFAELRGRDVSAVGQEIRLGFKTGGTVYLSSEHRALAYNYGAVKGDEALTNPATGSEWSQSDLNDIQFVVESGTIIG